VAGVSTFIWLSFTTNVPSLREQPADAAASSSAYKFLAQTVMHDRRSSKLFPTMSCTDIWITSTKLWLRSNVGSSLSCFISVESLDVSVVIAIEPNSLKNLIVNSNVASSVHLLSFCLMLDPRRDFWQDGVIL
jgi:hypothetical protein